MDITSVRKAQLQLCWEKKGITLVPENDIPI